jgi:hypothetical protein
VKVLVVIPHFFNPSGNGAYGSTGPEMERRAAVLEGTVAALHQSFGERQAFLFCMYEELQSAYGCNGKLARVNFHTAAQLDVLVCTTGSQHLVGKLGRIRKLFRHQPIECEPMLLGFGCHRLLRSALGRYDYYCYLEDDLCIRDPQFLQKVAWFTGEFGDETVLFPHRFELSGGEPVNKLYIDGPVRPDYSARWQDIQDRRVLKSQVMGQPLNFVRWANPHSGCFFLNQNQMRHWVSSPEFSSLDCSFAGPLESAASLGIMKHFRIYKPAAENAGFLELQHLHNRYLGHSLKFASPAAVPVG